VRRARRASRSKAESVKALVELKTRNHPAAVEHRRIYRPWGYYQDIDIVELLAVPDVAVTRDRPGGRDPEGHDPAFGRSGRP
jgi:mannose-1-phosphate guanylyltransferase/mannose-6-phosphate isomerase